MNDSTHNQFPEREESLWILTLPLAIWGIHFLVSYWTAAIWCARFSGPSRSLGPVRAAIGVYTMLALIGLGTTGWIGLRRLGFRRGKIPHDDDTPVDRHRFLGFTLLLLSSLGAVATLFVAAVVLFVETCD